MGDALNIIGSEHRGITAALQALRGMVEGARAGHAPEFARLRAIVYYLDAFAERLHHPLEDEVLFQPLRQRGGDAAALADGLEREHARCAAGLRSLEQALLRYEAGGAAEFVAFATAVEGYCEFYLRHMHDEETLVLPLARALFSAQDWARVDLACAAAREPRDGVDETGDFRRLLLDILGAAPQANGRIPRP